MEAKDSPGTGAGPERLNKFGRGVGNARGLSIDVHDSGDFSESFVDNGDVFIKDNVAINSRGIAMKDNPKTFSLIYEELEMGDMIGRGR